MWDAASDKLAYVDDGVHAAHDELAYVDDGVHADHDELAYVDDGVDAAHDELAYVDDGVLAARDQLSYVDDGVHAAHDELTYVDDGVHAAHDKLAYVDDGVLAAHDELANVDDGVHSAHDELVNVDDGVHSAHDELAYVDDGVHAAHDELAYDDDGVHAAHDELAYVDDGVHAAHVQGYDGPCFCLWTVDSSWHASSWIEFLYISIPPPKGRLPRYLSWRVSGRLYFIQYLKGHNGVVCFNTSTKGNDDEVHLHCQLYEHLHLLLRGWVHHQIRYSDPSTIVSWFSNDKQKLHQWETWILAPIGNIESVAYQSDVLLQSKTVFHWLIQIKLGPIGNMDSAKYQSDVCCILKQFSIGQYRSKRHQWETCKEPSTKPMLAAF